MAKIDEVGKLLSAQSKAGSFDKYARAMKDEVVRALTDFAEQDERFADAILCGGSFEECMKAVAKNPGNCISDVEAYRRAVQFYAQGARLTVSITVSWGTENQMPSRKEEDSLLDLSDFL